MDAAEKLATDVGTDLGVYCSIDRGKTWHSLCNHLPTRPVHDIAVHPEEDDVVIGTHGRSVLVLDAQEIKKKKQEPVQQSPAGDHQESARVGLSHMRCPNSHHESGSYPDSQ